MGSGNFRAANCDVVNADDGDYCGGGGGGDSCATYPALLVAVAYC